MPQNTNSSSDIIVGPEQISGHPVSYTPVIPKKTEGEIVDVPQGKPVSITRPSILQKVYPYGDPTQPLIKKAGEASERLRMDDRFNDDEKQYLSRAAIYMTPEQLEQTTKVMAGEDPKQKEDNIFTRILEGAEIGASTVGTTGAAVGLLGGPAGAAVAGGIGAGVGAIVGGAIGGLHKQKRYYLDKDGVAHALGYGELPPPDAHIESMWGNMISADDDNPVTSMAKGLYNGMIDVGKAVPNLAALLYGLSTGTDTKFLNDFNAAVDTAKFQQGEEASKPIVSADESGIHFTGNPSNMLATLGQVLASTAQFVGVAGGLGLAGKEASIAESIGAASKPANIAQKIAQNAPWKNPGAWAVSSMINLSESADAAKNAGLNNQAAYVFSGITAMGVGALELMMGGQEMRLLNKRKIFQSVAKEATENPAITADQMFKATLKTGVRDIAAYGKTIVKESLGEATEEATQDLFSQYMQVMYDKLGHDGNKYGTEIGSNESIASLLENAIGGFMGGMPGGIISPEKEQSRNEAIYNHVASNTTDQLLGELKLSVAQGNISPDVYEDVQQRVDTYKRYKQQIGKDADHMDDTGKRKLMEALWNHEKYKKMELDYTAQAESDPTNAYMAQKAKAAKQEAGKWEKSIDEIIKKPIQEEEKKPEGKPESKPTEQKVPEQKTETKKTTAEPGSAEEMIFNLSTDEKGNPVAAPSEAKKSEPEPEPEKSEEEKRKINKINSWAKISAIEQPEHDVSEIEDNSVLLQSYGVEDPGKTSSSDISIPNIDVETKGKEVHGDPVSIANGVLNQPGRETVYTDPSTGEKKVSISGAKNIPVHSFEDKDGTKYLLAVSSQGGAYKEEGYDELETIADRHKKLVPKRNGGIAYLIQLNDDGTVNGTKRFYAQSHDGNAPTWDQLTKLKNELGLKPIKKEAVTPTEKSNPKKATEEQDKSGEEPVFVSANIPVPIVDEKVVELEKAKPTLVLVKGKWVKQSLVEPTSGAAKKAARQNGSIRVNKNTVVKIEPETGKFLYFTNGKENTNLHHLMGYARKITPVWFKVWYNNVASQATKDKVDKMMNDFYDALENERHYGHERQTQDSIRLNLLRLLVKTKFTKDTAKDLTDVNEKVWIGKEGEKAYHLDTFVTDFLLDELEANGLRLEEDEAIEMVKDIIREFPNGITKKAIKAEKDRIKASDPLLQIEDLFQYETGMDIVSAEQIYQKIISDESGETTQDDQESGQAEVSTSTEPVKEEGKGEPGPEKKPTEIDAEKFNNLTNSAKKNIIVHYLKSLASKGLPAAMGISSIEKRYKSESGFNIITKKGWKLIFYNHQSAGHAAVHGDYLVGENAHKYSIQYVGDMTIPVTNKDGSVENKLFKDVLAVYDLTTGLKVGHVAEADTFYNNERRFVEKTEEDKKEESKIVSWIDEQIEYWGNKANAAVKSSQNTTSMMGGIGDGLTAIPSFIIQKAFVAMKALIKKGHSFQEAFERAKNYIRARWGHRLTEGELEHLGDYLMNNISLGFDSEAGDYVDVEDAIDTEMLDGDSALDMNVLMSSQQRMNRFMKKMNYMFKDPDGYVYVKGYSETDLRNITEDFAKTVPADIQDVRKYYFDNFPIRDLAHYWESVSELSLDQTDFRQEDFIRMQVFYNNVNRLGYMYYHNKGASGVLPTISNPALSQKEVENTLRAHVEEFLRDKTTLNAKGPININPYIQKISDAIQSKFGTRRLLYLTDNIKMAEIAYEIANSVAEKEKAQEELSKAYNAYNTAVEIIASIPEVTALENYISKYLSNISGIDQDMWKKYMLYGAMNTGSKSVISPSKTYAEKIAKKFIANLASETKLSEEKTFFLDKISTVKDLKSLLFGLNGNQSMIGRISNAISKLSLAEGYGSRFGDVDGNMTDALDFGSYLNDRANEITDPKVQKQYTHNDYVQSSVNGTHFKALDGIKNETTWENSTRGTMNIMEMWLMNLTNFFSKERIDMAPKGMYLQVIDQQADSAKKYFTPVRRQINLKQEDIIKKIQKVKVVGDKGKIYDLSKEDAINLLNKNINEVSDLIELFGKNGLLNLGISQSDIYDRGIVESLARDFVYNWVYNKFDLDEYYRDMNKTISYRELIKRKQDGKGLALLQNIPGGIGKTHRIAIFNDPLVKFSTGKYSITEADKTEATDGQVLMMPWFNRKIQISSGGMFNGIHKLFTFSKITGKDGQSKEFLVKANDVALPDPATEEGKLFYLANPETYEIVKWAETHGVDRVVFNSGAKLSDEIAQNHAIYQDGKIIMPDTANYVDIDNQHMKVMLDLTNDGLIKRGKLPIQMINIIRSTPNGAKIDELLQKATEKKKQAFIEATSKGATELCNWLIKNAPPSEERQMLLNVLKNSEPTLANPVVRRMINSYWANTLEKKLLNITVPKGLAVMTKIPGLKLRDIERGEKRNIHPEVMLPASYQRSPENPNGVNEGDFVFMIRVPTDDMHSIQLVRAKGFLPASMRNAVAIGDGIQIYSGNDFDGDTAHIWGLYRDKRGNPIVDDSYEGLMNSIFRIYVQEYDNPANFDRITNPIDTKSLKVYLKENYPDRLDHRLMPMSWHRMFKSNSLSKSTLERTAAAIKVAYNLASHNVRLKNMIRFPMYDEVTKTWTGRHLDLFGWSGTQKQKEANFAKLADHVNHAADDPKHGTLSMMNKFPSTVSVFDYILSMNSNAEKSIIALMHHPVIEQYIQAYEYYTTAFNRKKPDEIWDEIAAYVITGSFDQKLTGTQEDLLRNHWTTKAPFELSPEILNSKAIHDKLAVLNYFKTLSDYSSDMLSINSVINMNSKAPKTYGEYIVAKRNFERIREGKLRNIDTTDAQDFANSDAMTRASAMLALSDRYFAMHPMSTRTMEFTIDNIVRLFTTAEQRIGARGLIEKTLKAEDYDIIASALDSWMAIQALDIKDTKEEIRKQAATWYQKLDKESLLKETFSIDAEGKLKLRDSVKNQASDDISYIKSIQKEIAKLPDDQQLLLLKNQIREYGITSATWKGGYYNLLTQDQQSKVNTLLKNVQLQFDAELINAESLTKEIVLGNPKLIPEIKESRMVDSVYAGGQVVNSTTSKFFVNQDGNLIPYNESPAFVKVKMPYETGKKQQYKVYQAEERTLKSGAKIIVYPESKSYLLTQEYNAMPIEPLKKNNNPALEDNGQTKLDFMKGNSVVERDPAKMEYYQKHLSKMFPGVQFFASAEEFQAFVDRVSPGQQLDVSALGASIRNAYWINPESATQESILHEYAHIYWNMLPDSDPIKQRLLKAYGSVEEAIIAVGQQGSKVDGSASILSRIKTWMQNFWGRVKQTIWGNASPEYYARIMANNIWKGGPYDAKLEQFKSRTIDYMRKKISDFSFPEDAVKKIESIIGKTIDKLTAEDVFEKGVGSVQMLSGEKYWDAVMRKIIPNWKLSSIDEFSKNICDIPYDEIVRNTATDPRFKNLEQKIKDQYVQYQKDSEHILKNIFALYDQPGDIIRIQKTRLAEMLSKIDDMEKTYRQWSVDINSNPSFAHVYGAQSVLRSAMVSHMFADSIKGEIKEKDNNKINKYWIRALSEVLDPDSIQNLEKYFGDIFGEKMVRPDLSPQDVQSHLFALRNSLLQDASYNAHQERTVIAARMQPIYNKLRKLGVKGHEITYLNKNKPKGTFFINPDSDAYKNLGTSEKDLAIKEFADAYSELIQTYATLEMHDDLPEKMYQAVFTEMDIFEMKKKFGAIDTFLEKSTGSTPLYDNIHSGTIHNGLMLSLREYRNALQQELASKKITSREYYKKMKAEIEKCRKMYAGNEKLDAIKAPIVRMTTDSMLHNLQFKEDHTSSEDLFVSSDMYLNQLAWMSATERVMDIVKFTTDFMTRNDKPLLAMFSNTVTRYQLYNQSPESKLPPTLGRWLRFMNAWTALRYLALNLPATVFNFSAGLTQNIRDLGWRATARGLARTFQGIKLMKPTKDNIFEHMMMNNKASAIMKTYGLVEIQKEWNTSSASEFFGKIKQFLYSPIAFVEYFNHSVTMAGLMSNAEWKAYSNDGKIVDKANALTTHQMIALQYRANKIHGSYNMWAKRMIGTTPEGQTVVMLKTWLIDLWAEHFQQERYVAAVDERRTGLLRSGGKAAKSTIKALETLVKERDATKAKAHFDSLSTADKEGLHRLTREGIMMMAIGLVLMGMKGGDNDPDRKRLRRIWGDVGYVYDLTNLQFLFKNTIPTFGTINDMLELVKQIFFNLTGQSHVYQKNGEYGKAGDSTLPKYFVSILPMQSLWKMALKKD